LIASHAYTLIGAYDCGVNKLVQIRNPHGGNEWTGNWSDNDPKWTKQMIKKCNFVRGDDGAFFMSILDY